MMNTTTNFKEKQENQIKKQKALKTSLIKEQETSLLLSMVDINIIQNIFIQLVDQYKYSIYEQEEIKKTFTLLLNFCLSCKLFFQISKQPLFPLILNNININLNYKKYLRILHLKQAVEKDPFYKEKDINSIFHQSCTFGYFDIINTLINYGANINYQQGSLQYTPLMTATYHGNIKTVKKLIKFKNLNINQQDSVGLTSLTWMYNIGNEDMVKLLISRKDININIKDSFGMKALDWAKRKYFDLLEQMRSKNQTKHHNYESIIRKLSKLKILKTYQKRKIFKKNYKQQKN